MPTNFDTNFMDNNNDPVLANHVAQYAQPINDLEDDVDQLQADVTTNSTGIGTNSANIATNATDISTNTSGISTNATDISTNASNLSAHTGDNSNPHSVTALQAGAIPASDKGALNGVAELVNGTVPMSQLPSSGMGADELDDLIDVDLPTDPVADDMLKHNGAQFVKADPAAVRTALDVPTNANLTSGLAGKADSTHTHDASDITTGTMPVARGGTGGATAATARTSLDVPSNLDLTSGLAGKADNSGAVGDIAGLSLMEGELVTTASNIELRKTNLSATADPTVSDNFAAGYQVGSTWFYNDKFHVCSGDGVWRQLYPAASSGGSTNVVYGSAYKDTLTPATGTGAFAWSSTTVSDVTAGSNYLELDEDGLYRVTLTTTMESSSSQPVELAISINNAASIPAATSIEHYNHSVVDPTSASCDFILDLNSGDKVYACYDVSSSNLTFTNVTMTLQKLQPSAVSYETLSTGDVPVGNEGDVMTTVSGAWVAADASGHTHDASDITSGVLPVNRGGTSLSSISSNRLLGSGSSANAIQSISVGSGLSLSGGTLSNTQSSGVTGSGASNRLAFWSGSSSLSSNSLVYLSGSTIYCGNVRAQYIPIYSSSGANLYAYTSGAKGLHHHWTSSKKFKKNIRKMEKISQKLSALRPVRYDGTAPARKENGEVDLGPDGVPKTAFEESFGLIAEDVKEVFPDLVYDIQLENGESTIGVHYNRLPIYHLQMLQEQQEELDFLRQDSEEMKRKMEQLETELSRLK